MALIDDGGGAAAASEEGSETDRTGCLRAVPEDRMSGPEAVTNWLNS